MKKEKETPQEQQAPQETPQEAPQEETLPEPTEAEKAAQAQAQAQAEEHDRYLRLAAEYDNFRKRTQREKDGIYRSAVADTVERFLPVWDDLERALKNETADEAYKKGVEMTRNGLLKILEGLDVHVFGEAGDPFDPEKHNAVMHCQDESLGENVVAEVFQAGFRLGDRVIRCAMVRVAN